jgi:uncharacterized Fe-S radical SAM superfamily protein PflX
MRKNKETKKVNYRTTKPTNTINYIMMQCKYTGEKNEHVGNCSGFFQMVHMLDIKRRETTTKKVN